VPSSALLCFSFRTLGDQSGLSKTFLLTSLISVYTLKPTGTSFESNWTWFLWIELDFWKMSKNVNFSETCFSQENEVRLRMSTIYVITKKNGFDWFHWVLSCFALKMEFFWKSGKVRLTLWFWWFHSIGPVKRTCMHTYTHMWLMFIYSWGNWVVFLSFGSIVVVVSKLWNIRRTWLNLILKLDYLAYILWMVWYDYVEICE